MLRIRYIVSLMAALTLLLFTVEAQATPFFARTYNLSCQTCHSGFPRLNAYGLAFKYNNFRIPGGEREARLAWKTVPITAQVQPYYQRISPGGGKNQFTDTQLLAGGLLTRTTAFYLHHSYFIDATPTEFPSYELWIQQVVDERTKAMIKAGQFELPYGYSPLINRTTASSPLLFGAGVQDNDVRLGFAMNGVQFSVGDPEKTQLFFAVGEPASLTGGILNSEHYFFGRFRDVFVRVTAGKFSRQVGLFTYLTSPPRDPADARTKEHGQRIGLDGALLLHNNLQLHGMAVYGENSNPLGDGKRGFFRSAFAEADQMFLPWLGLTGRWDVQTISAGGKDNYSDARSVAIRFYPYHSVKLMAEYQQLDHDKSTTYLFAAITF
jgi:hypothetical protein